MIPGDDEVRVAIDGAVMTITIDRPKANAIDLPTSRKLGEAFVYFRDNPELKVAVITGAGERIFCAGWDLKALDAGDTPLENWWEAEDPDLGGFAGITEMWNLNKPVIAALNGLTIGGGFEIALACDLIIASENATFALPEPKVGLAALAGGLNRLPRQIGVKRALGMILTGRHVPAAEGYELGFVNEVVAHDELMAAARRWAEQICECAPLSIRASKDVVYRSLDSASLADSMAAQYDSVKAMVNSEDFVEGPKAFAEKRKPNWKGR